MKIYYVFSKEDSQTQIQNNWNRCLEILPQAKKVQGCNTIAETYRYLCSLSNNTLFTWIDGDNWLLPEAAQVTTITSPTIFMTTNQYGIVYGHGGIKVCKSGMYLREGAIDITWYLGLTPVDIVASVHQLGEDWIHIRAVFVEMIKNALKGDNARLAQWCDARPDIWHHAQKLLSTGNIATVTDIIRYRSSFREFYEDSMRSDL